MRRLNVRFAQIEECIRTSLFAVDVLPRNPPFEPGELLLLRLVKDDAVKHGKLDSRIEFALVFDHVVEDPDGSVSRKSWPNAGKVWRYILVCSETVPTLPFSLERLGLNRDYAGQGNAIYIQPDDEAVVRTMLQPVPTASRPLQVAHADVLRAIRNFDRIMRDAPIRETTVREHQRVLGDPFLSDALKRYYSHRCQICQHDFTPRYGVPFADTRVAEPKEARPRVLSTNLLVLCPNHNSIIGAAGALFHRAALEYRYPNGLAERLTLTEHLVA
jgi:hypothetical protein